MDPLGTTTTLIEYGRKLKDLFDQVSKCLHEQYGNLADLLIRSLGIR